MTEELRVGDRVVTRSGRTGTVTSVAEDTPETPRRLRGRVLVSYERGGIATWGRREAYRRVES